MQMIFTRMTLLGGSLLLAACAQQAGQGGLSERYGQATAVNAAQQIAYKSPNEYLIELNRLFAAEADPVVTFAFNSARLDATARKALDSQAAWLRENPEVRMSVTGHTDAVGTEAYNDRLGLRRAKAVINYLVRRGVSRSRLDALESRGESDLLVKTENRERRNRRAVTEVAGFVINYVGTGMDGRKAEAIYEAYRTTINTSPTEAEVSDVEG